MMQKKEPAAFSSYNTGQNGTKGAYLLLERLGFSVSRTDTASKELAHGNVLVLMEPGLDYAAESSTIKELNQWVYEGNTMVLAGNHKKYFAFSQSGKKDSSLPDITDFKLPLEYDKAYYDLSYGSGRFRLVSDTALFQNSGLSKEGTATKLTTLMWDFHEKNIVFIEKGSEKLFSLSSGWRESPLKLLNTTWQLILLQIVIGIILLLFFTGGRVGLPLTYKRGMSRDENEDVEAFGRLMEQSGLSKDAMLLYYEQFQKEAVSYFKTQDALNQRLLEGLWSQWGLNNIENLKEVNEWILKMKDSKKVSCESVVKFFQNLDILREEIK